jgi:hypothetical protein
MAAPAAAQDTGEARSLFEQGLAAAREQRWDDALQAFRSSLAIVERPSTLLNLAAAEAETGHVTSSVTSYRRFLELAPARDAHRRSAEAALAAAQARLAHLSLHVEGRQPGDSVSLDQLTLMPAALEAPIDVDPGPHTVTITRAGREVAHAQLTLADGASETLAVAVVAAALPERTVVAVQDSTETPATDEASSDDTVWIVLGVCLGVAVAAGVTAGIVVATQPSAPDPYMGNFGGVVRF